MLLLFQKEQEGPFSPFQKTSHDDKTSHPKKTTTIPFSSFPPLHAPLPRQWPCYRADAFWGQGQIDEFTAEGCTGELFWLVVNVAGWWPETHKEGEEVLLLNQNTYLFVFRRVWGSITEDAYTMLQSAGLRIGATRCGWGLKIPFASLIKFSW